MGIDSMAYLEYGDTKVNVFIKWLDEFSDLSSQSITSLELWEHRNSLLHMSNLDARKVKTGKIRRLIMYHGTTRVELKEQPAIMGFYHLDDLIKIIGDACEKWGNSFNANSSKWKAFFERYDLIASDSRMLEIDLGGVI